MKKICLSCFGFFVLLCAHGQRGNIKGIVSDENGLALSGASIIISGINKGTVSDLEGRFTLVNIVSGEYNLIVSYLGYAITESPIDINPRQTSFISVILTPTSIRLKGVELVEKGTTAKIRALNTQKTNLNVSNVVSTDQIGKFPDANIGDALKRIAGIAIKVDQGEARDIIIRGLSPELNSVTLNGSRIPSAEGDNRNIQLDLIPSDMIQTIEVNKTLTPDMDADALGGSVNLITRTSPQGFRVSATMGSGINFISNKRIYNTSFLYGDRSANDKLGWMVSATLNDNDFGSDNIEVRWADNFGYNTGNLDQDGTPIIEEQEVVAFPMILEVQPRWIQRVRRSFSANFDYQWNNNNSLFLKTIYNWRDDRENRFVFEQEILPENEIGPEDFTVNAGILEQFPVLVSRQTRGGINSRRSKNGRLEDQRMQNYTLGGNHLLGSVKLDWISSFAKAFEDISNQRTAEFKSEYTIRTDLSNPKSPLFLPENSDDPGDLAAFEYDEIIEENKYTEEEDLNFFLNATIPAKLLKKSEGELKIGLRSRLKSKLRENDFFSFDLESNFPTLADAPTLNYSDPGYLAGNRYQAGFFADELWLGNLDLRDGEEESGEFLRQNFTATENVYAAYAMVDQKVGEKFNFIAGLRLEYTTFKATANTIVEGSSTVGTSHANESYATFMPGIHLKYMLSPKTILRFAWTNTLARPNYVDMVPTSEVVLSDREVLVGNSGLNPAVSSNFDLMAEHYLNTVGLLSVGVFDKNIKNFTYTFKSELTDDRFGAGTTGFDLFQPLNGEEASLFGLELNFERRLDFLPVFAANITLNLNYTYLNSKTEGVRDINGVEREDLNLPNTPPHLFNASLAYEGSRFKARLAANFSDAYIDEVGGRSFEDIYYDRQFFLDFKVNYDLSKHLSLYLDLNNITDQPKRLYQGIHERTATAEYYDRRLTFGLKYDLFRKK